MKHYAPDYRLPEDVPVQTGYEDKLGGLPWGLDSSSWPKCKVCGRSQSFLVQWKHHAERLDLGREGRVLFAFQCSSVGDPPCDGESFDPWGGANACFVVEPGDLVDGPTPKPADCHFVEPELRIARWVEREQNLDVDPAAPIGTVGSWLGGVPVWLQPSEDRGGDWQFAGQIDSNYELMEAPKNGKLRPNEEGIYFAWGPQFGDGGVGYVFLKKRWLRLPEAMFFWHCT